MGAQEGVRVEGLCVKDLVESVEATRPPSGSAARDAFALDRDGVSGVAAFAFSLCLRIFHPSETSCRHVGLHSVLFLARGSDNE